jgi:hypothetical protein
LAGCSGAGAPASQVSGAPVQSLATDQLSAVTLVSSWSRLLYAQMTTPTVNNTKFFLNGANRNWGTESDGGVFDFYEQKSGQQSGSITWPDGMSVHFYWSAPVITAAAYTYVGHTKFSDGTRFDFSLISNTNAPYPQNWEGSAHLANGQTARFTLNRIEPDSGAPSFDTLGVRLPDGSALHLTVPTQTTASSLFWPTYTSGADGSLVAGSEHLNFHLSGNATQWDKWQFSTTAGAHGSFALNSDFSGAGTLRQGAGLSGSLQWNANALGSLSLLGAAATAVSPSAAAQAFDIDRWLTNAALLGPSPEY